MAGSDEHQQPNPEPDHNRPEWCKRGHCIVMPTPEENKCCTQSRQACIPRTNLFEQLILDDNVLEIAM